MLNGIKVSFRYGTIYHSVVDSIHPDYNSMTLYENYDKTRTVIYERIYYFFKSLIRIKQTEILLRSESKLNCINTCTF